MPKMKTHKGAKKRFKVTGSGKIMRRRRNPEHFMRKRSGSQNRRLAKEAEVTGGDREHVRDQLGI
jgi:large subunit ribosomal protein L35